MTPLDDWALLWGIPPEALEDLANRVTMAAQPPIVPADPRSEAYTQSLARMAAPAAGMVLWRNNVGALRDDNGRPVRYGLANDSKSLNETIKSADLIGWRSERITVDMVGTVVARFVSIECKHSGWPGFNPKDPHEAAQKRWADLVTAAGGYARFSVGGVE